MSALSFVYFLLFLVVVRSSNVTCCTDAICRSVPISGLTGNLVSPSNSSWEIDRLAENMMFNYSTPCAIAYVKNTQDIQNAVRWAVQFDVDIAMRSGGHSYEGFSVGNGIIIDTSRMTGIQVDAAAATAEVEAGVLLIDLYSHLSKLGFMVPGGTCPTVGVAGFTLGGGFGFSARKYGMMVDSLLQAEVVLGDGSVVVANKSSHSDLFWGCTGGSGSFGVVTKFTFQLHHTPIGNSAVQLTAYWVLSDLHKVVDAWQNWAPYVDDRVTSQLHIDVGGLAFAALFNGPKEDAVVLFKNFLRGVGVAAASTGVKAGSWMDAVYWLAGCKDVYSCTHSGVRTAFKAKSDYVSEPFNVTAMDTINKWIRIRATNKTHAWAGIMFDSYGGKINEMSTQATAFPHRDKLFVVQYMEYWYWQKDSPVLSQDWIRAFYNDMRPYVSGMAYRNYADLDLSDWEHRYFGVNWERLQEIKAKYDPTNKFKYKQSVYAPTES